MVTLQHSNWLKDDINMMISHFDLVSDGASFERDRDAEQTF